MRYICFTSDFIQTLLSNYNFRDIILSVFLKKLSYVLVLVDFDLCLMNKVRSVNS